MGRLMNHTHYFATLSIVLLWISAVMGIVVGIYIGVVSNIPEAEIRAVALTVMLFVGFLWARMPLAMLRALFAMWIVTPLLGLGNRERSPWWREFSAYWVRLLDNAGWDLMLSEKPAYKKVADDVHNKIQKIERKLPSQSLPKGVESVIIVHEEIALDVGEEHVRGRIVDLCYLGDALDDIDFLNRLATGARSESVRIAARRRLTALRDGMSVGP